MPRGEWPKTRDELLEALGESVYSDGGLGWAMVYKQTTQAAPFAPAIPRVVVFVEHGGNYEEDAEFTMTPEEAHALGTALINAAAKLSDPEGGAPDA